jgi:hypothetical protein
MPKMVEEAYSIDQENVNDYWQKVIRSELNDMMVAFQLLLEDDKHVPIGHQYSHVIRYLILRWSTFEEKQGLLQEVT